MEDARREHRVGAGTHGRREVLGRPCATARDHRDADGGTDQGDELEVETVLGAIGVHRVEQDLAGTEFGSPCAPLHGIHPGAGAPTVGRHLETVQTVGTPADIGREHEDLRAETLRHLGDELRAGDRRRVDSHLVGPAAQQAVHVVDRAHAATDSEWDEHLLGRAPHHVVGGRPITAAGRDIEEGQLVGPLGAIGAGQFNGVAGVSLKINANALNGTVFFPAQQKGEYSLWMSGWGTLTGEASYTYGSLVHTADPALGLGAFNKQGYSNAEVDKLIEAADVQVDATKRMLLYHDAQRLVIGDAPYIIRSTSKSSFLVKPYVKGFDITPQDSNTYPGMTTGLLNVTMSQ